MQTGPKPQHRKKKKVLPGVKDTTDGPAVLTINHNTIISSEMPKCINFQIILKFKLYFADDELRSVILLNP